MYTNGGFVSHLKSDCHVNAVIAWRDFERRDAVRSVVNMLTDEQTRQIQANRHWCGDRCVKIHMHSQVVTAWS
jgi:hypothetical protein